MSTRVLLILLLALLALVRAWRYVMDDIDAIGKEDDANRP